MTNSTYTLDFGCCVGRIDVRDGGDEIVAWLDWQDADDPALDCLPRFLKDAMEEAWECRAAELVDELERDQRGADEDALFERERDGS